MNNEITKTVEFYESIPTIIDMNNKGYLLIDTEHIQDEVSLTFRRESRQNMSGSVTRKFTELEDNVNIIAQYLNIDLKCNGNCDECDCDKSENL